MSKFYKNIVGPRIERLLAILLIVVFGVGIYGNSALAIDVIAFAEGVIIGAVGGVMEIFIYAIGTLLSASIKILILIANYDNFRNESVVQTGWEQVRNLSNMFFILILLVIAFATILRVESYNIKRQLPKLIMMAVLINFSKTICGIIIEFSQIIMMIFLNTIDKNGSGFINLLGVENFLQFVKDNKWDGEIGTLSVSAGYFLALLFLIIALVTIISFMGVLLMRMIMLWVYIILSPLAYLLAAFPQGQTYASRWWSEFTKYVITGPVLAFFLWLALISAGTSKHVSDGSHSYGPWDVISTDNFLQFIIGIGMLVGGLKITSEIGGTVGSAAGTGMGWIQSGKAVTVKYAKSKAWGGAKAVGRGTLGVARGTDRIIARGANKVPGVNVQGGLIGTGLQKTKNLATLSWVGDRNKNKIEADKSRYSYHKAELGAAGDEAAMKKLRLKMNGKEYKEDDNKQFYLVNKGGDAIHENGKKVEDGEARTYASRKGYRGQDKNITAMGAKGADMFMGRAGASSMAWAAAKQATDEKISTEQAKIEASGMTADMMMQEIKDGNVDGTKKMALALTMAVKNGFNGKTDDDVKDAKEQLGSNQILVKKFNDAVDKKFAHLNHNVSTESGKASFIKRLEGGKIDDVMDKSAYENKDVLNAIQESKGPVGFNDYIKKVGQTKAHKESVKKGLISNFDKNKIMKDGSVDSMRKAMVELSGDVGEAFQDLDLNNQEQINGMKDAMNNLLDGYTAKQVANIDIDSFDKSKMSKHFSNSDSQTGTFLHNFKKAINNNMTQKDAESAKRAGAANNLEVELKKWAKANPKNKTT